METQKQDLMENLKAKGMSMPQIAEAVGVEARLLDLYFAEDSYPVPKRIVAKMTELAAQ